MIYLVLEILGFLSIATAFGFVIGWLLHKQRFQKLSDTIDNRWSSRFAGIERRIEALEMLPRLVDEHERILESAEERFALASSLRTQDQLRREVEERLALKLRELKLHLEAMSGTQVVSPASPRPASESGALSAEVMDEHMTRVHGGLDRDLSHVRTALSGFQSELRALTSRFNTMETAWEAHQRDAHSALSISLQAMRERAENLARALDSIRDDSGAAPVDPKEWVPGRPHAEATDDLKMIKGVGPALEKKLNGLGIFTFVQLADLESSAVPHLGYALGGYTERLLREDWIGQAKMFAGVEETSADDFEPPESKVA